MNYDRGMSGTCLRGFGQIKTVYCAVAIRSGSGTIYDQSAGNNTYVWGTGIDNLLAMTVHGATSTNTYYAIKDHQNSVIALTDDSGSVVESYEYDAWGNTKVFDAIGTELTASAYGNRYGFQGREIDWTTGLYYFRARWYDSETGHWISKDPKGIAGGLNLYVAFGNNPVNFVDPMGLEFSVGGSAGATFAVGGGVGVNASFSVSTSGISGNISVTRETGARVAAGVGPTINESRYDAGDSVNNAGFGIFSLQGNAGNVGVTGGRFDLGFSQSNTFWGKEGGITWKGLWNNVNGLWNDINRRFGDDC